MASFSYISHKPGTLNLFNSANSEFASFLMLLTSSSLDQAPGPAPGAANSHSRRVLHSPPLLPGRDEVLFVGDPSGQWSPYRALNCAQICKKSEVTS